MKLTFSGLCVFVTFTSVFLLAASNCCSSGRQKDARRPLLDNYGNSRTAFFPQL